MIIIKQVRSLHHCDISESWWWWWWGGLVLVVIFKNNLWNVFVVIFVAILLSELPVSGMSVFKYNNWVVCSAMVTVAPYVRKDNCPNKLGKIQDRTPVHIGLTHKLTQHIKNTLIYSTYSILVITFSRKSHDLKSHKIPFSWLFL